MKTEKSVKCRMSSVENKPAGAGPCRRASRAARHTSAFTLVEMLTVIAIIAVIAALLLPVASTVRRHAVIQTAQSEMAQLETAIERYHTAYGFYPPDGQAYGPLTNQLYYELVGTTNIAPPSAVPIFEPIGNPSHQLKGGPSPSGQVISAFGVSGFMNCNKAGADESAQRAQDFLPDIKPAQIGTISISSGDGVFSISNLITSVGGPDPNYQPCGAQDLNPWRYIAPGINNPGSYDLYVQLVIAGTTNLVCNWNKQVQINSPLP